MLIQGVISEQRGGERERKREIGYNMNIVLKCLQSRVCMCVCVCAHLCVTDIGQM